MDKQKNIEENGKELYNDLSSIMSEEYEKRMLITPSYCANKMLEKGYRKIPEGAVLLTGTETEERLDDLLIEFDEMGFYPLTTCANAEKYVKDWKRKLIYAIGKLRKETAEKFAKLALEGIKAISVKSEYLLEDESVYEDSSLENVIEKVKIEICKEITEGKNNA